MHGDPLAIVHGAPDTLEFSLAAKKFFRALYPLFDGFVRLLPANLTIVALLNVLPTTLSGTGTLGIQKGGIT